MLKVHAFGGSRLQPCISRASGSLTSNFHGEFYYGTLRKLNLEPEGKLLLGHSCKLRIHFGARPSTVYTKLQLNHFSLSQHQHQQLAPRVDCASSCCRCLCTFLGHFVSFVVAHFLPFSFSPPGSSFFLQSPPFLGSWLLSWLPQPSSPALGHDAFFSPHQAPGSAGVPCKDYLVP